MTKKEMLEVIFEGHWGLRLINEIKKRCKKDYLTRIYESFLKDKENGLFYRSLLLVTK